MNHKRILLAGGLAGLGALALTGGHSRPADAQSATGRSVVVGDTLLGIRIDHSTYADVLRMYGPPADMQAGTPRLTDAMLGISTNPNGANTPGLPGAAGTPGTPGANGMPAEDGPGGTKYPVPSSGQASTPTSTPGGPAPVYGTSRSGPGGFPGGNSGSGAPGMPGVPGASPRTGTNSDDDKYVEKKQGTWWYHFPHKGKPTLHYSFLFNKEGKVIQIQEFGYGDGGKTKDGIGLGATLGDVMRTYGFSADGERIDNDHLTMRFGGSNKLAVQMAGNRVRGLTLAKVK